METTHVLCVCVSESVREREREKEKDKRVINLVGLPIADLRDKLL